MKYSSINIVVDKIHDEIIGVNIMKNKNSLISFLSLLCVILFPCFFLYFRNLGIASFQDFLNISGIIIIFGLLILFFSYLFNKDFNKAILLTSVICVFLLYFRFIENAIVNIFPMFYYWHILLLLFLLIIHIAFWLKLKISVKIAENLNQGILIIFSGLIIYNFIISIPKIIEINSQITKINNLQESEHLNIDQEITNNNASKQKLPNVYYFIFDEYGGYDNLLRYCNYDNNDFYVSLEQLGFNTSKNSVNDTIDTYTEIPNLLQLKKINSIDMVGDQKKENLKNPYLLLLMKEHGYSVNGLDSSNYTFIDASLTDTRLSDNFVSTYGSFNSYIIKNSFFYPFFGNEDHQKEISQLIRMFDYAKSSSKIADTNLFTIGYFSFPHVPYIVDENGNKTNDEDRLNLRDPIIYLNQLKYANIKIFELVNEIIINDPASIIILQSDHGYRLPSHLHFWYGLDEYDLEIESPYQRNILNAVYYLGENLEIEGLSGLDTLLKVLNNLQIIN